VQWMLERDQAKFEKFHQTCPPYRRVYSSWYEIFLLPMSLISKYMRPILENHPKVFLILARLEMTPMIFLAVDKNYRDDTLPVRETRLGY
jgi:hypothetical protein